MTRKRPHLIRQDPDRPPLAVLPVDQRTLKHQNRKPLQEMVEKTKKRYAKALKDLA